jgi:hypothetical protein
VNLIVFVLDVDEVRAMLRTACCTVSEERHWMLWRRLEVSGSPQALDRGKRVLEAWKAENFWREQW